MYIILAKIRSKHYILCTQKSKNRENN